MKNEEVKFGDRIKNHRMEQCLEKPIVETSGDKPRRGDGDRVFGVSEGKEIKRFSLYC